jgi:hypothetical protein
VLRGVLPLYTPVPNRGRKFPCGILSAGLVFENVRQRVGCGSLLTLKHGVLSIAVEHERSLLTADNLRNPILLAFASNGKTFVRLRPPGGVSLWA